MRRKRMWRGRSWARFERVARVKSSDSSSDSIEPKSLATGALEAVTRQGSWHSSTLKEA
jgi:hypothetical protein